MSVCRCVGDTGQRLGQWRMGTCRVRFIASAQASNVCVTGSGRVYLRDLGAAKKLQTRLSSGPCDFGSFVRLATFVGSPAAMAPVRTQRALR